MGTVDGNYVKRFYVPALAGEYLPQAFGDNFGLTLLQGLRADGERRPSAGGEYRGFTCLQFLEGVGR